MDTTTTSPKSSSRREFLFLRGLGGILLIAILLGGLCWLCLHHDADVAAWSGAETDPKASLTYEDKTYYRAAAIGTNGLSEAEFLQGELLGEVKPAGRETWTVTYPVYAVQSGGTVRDGYLIVMDEDEATGKDAYVLYFAEGQEDPRSQPEETDDGTQAAESAA